MTKKIITATVLLFILLFTLIAWQLSTKINAPVLKAYISTQLSNITEQPVRIDGHLNWSLLPHPGLNVDTIIIGDAANSGAYNLKLNGLKLNLKLTSLLTGQLVFDDIHVSSFDLAVNTAMSKKPQATVVTKPESIPATNSIDFLINRLEINKGAITFGNATNPIRLTNLSIAANDINLNNEIFHFDISTNIKTLLNGKTAEGSIEFQGKTHLDKQALKTIKTVWLYGQLRAHSLRMDNFVVDKLSATTLLKAGLLSFKPLTINLYNSTSVGELYYNLNTQQLSLKQSAVEFDSAKLYESLFNKKGFEGKLDLSIDSTIDLAPPYTRSAVGKINIKDGAYNGVDLNQFIVAISEQLSVLFSNKQFDMNKTASDLVLNYPSIYQGKTVFKVISIPFKINNELFSSDALLLQMDNLKLTGNSTINLSNYDVRAHLKAVISSSLPKVIEVQNYLDGSFPIVIKGTVQNPVLLPDLSIINPIVTRTMITETLSKPLNKAKEHFKNLLNIL